MPTSLAVVLPPHRAVQSFEDRAARRESYRLPKEQQGDLRGLFAASRAPMRSSWSEQVEGWAGGAPGRDRFALFDAEAHCDLHLSADPRTPYARERRCLRALTDLLEQDDLLSVAVLKRQYGSPKPADRYDLFPEVAPLAEMTGAVRELAMQRESSRRAEARARFLAFWKREADAGAARREERALISAIPASMRGDPGTWTEMKWWSYVGLWRKLLEQRARDAKSAERARLIQLGRVLSDAPLDTSSALREGLDMRVDRREGESKGSFAERSVAKRAARTTFILRIRTEGDALLASASSNFREAWYGPKPKQPEEPKEPPTMAQR